MLFHLFLFIRLSANMCGIVSDPISDCSLTIGRDIYFTRQRSELSVAQWINEVSYLKPYH